MQCALCLLVSRAPSLSITPRALQELDKVLQLFQDASDYIPRVASYLVSLLPANTGHLLNSVCVQVVLDRLVARAREYYVNWRGGVSTTHNETTDEISLLARRIVPATGEVYAASDATMSDSFEHAHPFLRRSLDQATAADPCTPTGLHLTRIRGPVGSILHAQSDMRSYSAPGELSTTRARALSWSSGSRSGHPAGEGPYPANGSALGADIGDNGWMSWL